MFNSKTLYALNKKDPDAIVYINADGQLCRLTRADFDTPEEFDRWKEWSDQDLHNEDNRDQVYQHHTRSMNEVVDMVALDPEMLMIQRIGKREQEQYVAHALACIKHLLTEKQYRRMWMWGVEKKTTREIARWEGTSHQGISKSLVAVQKKIKKYFEKGQ